MTQRIYDLELARGYPYFTYPDFCQELAARCREIVEVGSWKGFSTVAFALALQQRPDSGVLHAVDVWNGKGAMWGDFVKRFPVDSGEHLFACFKHHLQRAQVADIVDPIRLPSTKAAAAFATAGRQFDAVFIDADHSYSAVCADIRAWRPLVRPGGVLCGHDYNNKSVQRAVDELVPGVELRPGHVWMRTL